MAHLKAAKKNRIADDVFQQMLATVSDKTWKEGDKIPSENELARTFAVSRSSVRTAIQRLAALGILESYQGGGTYVAQHDGRQVINPLVAELAVNPKSEEELLELREAIEVTSCEYAALRADESDLRRIKAALEDMATAADRKQLVKYCKADVEFHVELARASKNSVFLYLYEMIQEILYDHFVKNTTRFGFPGNLPIHYDIYAAVEQKNIDAAGKFAKKNISRLRLLQDNDSGGPPQREPV